MRYIYFLALLALLTLQANLVAQPNSTPSAQTSTNYRQNADTKATPYSSQTQAYDQDQDVDDEDDGEEEENDYDNDDNDDNDNDDSRSSSRGSLLAMNGVDTRATSPNQVKDAYAAPKPDELRSNEKIERTLSILKPDALKNRHIGDIISRFEDAGLHIAALKMVKLSPEQASQFYAIHRERSFFPELVKYISSGPVVVMVLEGDQAISKNRQLMGATDPKKAEKGTIRADFAQSMSQNAVHGSDSPETAKQEIIFFFKPDEIYAGY